MTDEKKKIKQVNILGVPFYAMTWQESLKIFEALLLAGNQYQIAKANPEFVMTAQNDAEDMAVLNKTAFNVADGTGILWAAAFLNMKSDGYFGTLIKLWLSLASIILYPKFIKKVLPERIGGVEHVINECELAARHGVPIFLMGASDAARAGTKNFLEQNIPEIVVAGHIGSYDPFKDENRLIDAVNATEAGFLIVCFGHPLQEKWISKNLKKMPNIRVADGEGGTFDYLAGIQKRAPKGMRKIHLEWFWRIFTQKGRGDKMKKSLPRFIKAVFRAKLSQNSSLK